LSKNSSRASRDFSGNRSLSNERSTKTDFFNRRATSSRPGLAAHIQNVTMKTPLNETVPENKLEYFKDIEGIPAEVIKQLYVAKSSDLALVAH
jgi:hypothetical protein